MKKTPHFLEGLKTGALHKDLGVSENKKIPASKLAIKKTDSTLEKRRKVFAQNASHWKKRH